MTAEFQLALTQIPAELRQMKMGDVLKLASRGRGIKANAVDDDDDDSEMEISIEQTLKQRLRCKSADSALKAKSTRSIVKAPSLKKAESTGCLSEKFRKSRKKASIDVKQSEVYYTRLGGKEKITNIIPKVDPSKPLARSSMRKPLPGELLFSLSATPVDFSSLLESRNIKPNCNTNTTVAELRNAAKMLKKNTAEIVFFN